MENKVTQEGQDTSITGTPGSCYTAMENEAAEREDRVQRNLITRYNAKEVNNIKAEKWNSCYLSNGLEQDIHRASSAGGF